MKEQLIYLDGEYVTEDKAKISVFDHGVLYGDGVFEGIRAYNGRIFKFKEHIDALLKLIKNGIWLRQEREYVFLYLIVGLH